MKKNYFLLFGLLLFSLEYASAALPEFNSGKYYYIWFGRDQNDKKGDGLNKRLAIQDNSSANNESAVLTAQWVVADQDKQLWKFDGTQEDFTLTSKEGRVVCHESGSASDTKFKTATPGDGVTADHFKIEYRGAYFVIKRIAESNANSYINPSGGSKINNPIQLWSNADKGSWLDFSPTADVFASHLPSLRPELSTAENEHWYYIRSRHKDYNGMILQNNGSSNATGVVLSECNQAQFWKLVGSYDNGFKVVNYDGNEFFVNNGGDGGSRAKTVVPGSGHTFKFGNYIFSSGNELIDNGDLALYATNYSSNNYLSLQSGEVPFWPNDNNNGDRVVEFIPVATRAVTVTAGDNVSEVRVTAPIAGDAGTEPFQVPCSGKITITYKVETGCVPTVTVGSATHPIGTLSGDTYTVTVEGITSATEIVIAAEEASYEVTVNVPDKAGISITSPALDNDDKYLSPASSEIFFTLLAGRENVDVTVPDGVTKNLSNSGNNYMLALSNISDNITVVINVSKIKQTVKIDASPCINVTNMENYPKDVDYSTYEQVHFTLADGYHSPIVRINGNNQNLVNNNGTYIFNFTVKANTTILIHAFPANVLPVTSDTYVTGGGDDAGHVVSGNYSSDTELWVERTTQVANNSRWNYRAYLWFNATTAIKDAGYNKIKLRLSGASIQKKPSGNSPAINLYMEVRKVDASSVESATNLAWNSNPAEVAAPKGTAIENAEQLVQLSDKDINGKEFVLDITDSDILDKIAGGEHVLLLLNALCENASTQSDGYIRFHSRENTINPAYVPQLIFEKTATPNEIVDVSKFVGYQGDIVFASNDEDGTGQLTYTGSETSFSFQSPGKVKLVKTFKTDQWYPIGFPFAIENSKITVKYGTTTVPGKIYDGDTGEHAFTQSGDAGSEGCNFFVKKYDAGENYFIFDDKIVADTGYIVEFPKAEFGQVETVEVTFVSTSSPELTIGATGANIPSENANLSLVVNPNVSNITGIGNAMDYYQYSYDQNRFSRIGEGSENITLSTQLKPFEAIIAVKANTPDGDFRSSIGDGSSGTTVLEPLPSVEYPLEVRYYTMQGVRIYSPQENGVYIVKKVYASGKTDISKAIYKNKGL
jgi:hypothetical protein